MSIRRSIETVLVALIASCCGAFLGHALFVTALTKHGSIGFGSRAFEQSVSNYIRLHPGEITAAINANRVEQASQQQSRVSALINAHRSEIAGDTSSPTIGPKNASVVITEFFDFRCAYCKSTAPLLEQIIRRDPDLKIVFKNLPVLGPDSVYAARLGYGAARDGRFGDLYKIIFDTVPAHGDRAMIDKALHRGGLDPTVLYARAQERVTEEALGRDRQLAETLGITGTPALIVGEKLLQGQPTEEELVAAIVAARHRSRQ